MNDVISFFFWILTEFWTLMLDNWIIAFPVVLGIFGLIVNLMVSARQSN